MAIEMKGRHILSIHDLSGDEVCHILDTAEAIKKKHALGERNLSLQGKTLGMIFHKNSTRTRISFEVAAWQLGGYALYLNANDLQLKRGETIADTARILSRFVDGVVIRTYSQQEVAELARHASIPVINGLTDLLHPCQVLSDLLTIKEKLGRLAGLTLLYLGDGNNIAHSLMLGGAKTGLNIIVCTPEGREPDAEIARQAREDAAITGAEIELCIDPGRVIKKADLIYTDAWASMGREEQPLDRKIFSRYQVNRALLAGARPEALVMHCLPAHRGEEITDEVIDGPQSIVFDQAENRLHLQKAL
ncbi:MAG TPA: ornithine carbamoyltransferase, partial [Firmicutes bacterium]|nr:ornithine carbamoyltransferase [Bacillota bacterium]